MATRRAVLIDKGIHERGGNGAILVIRGDSGKTVEMMDLDMGDRETFPRAPLLKALRDVQQAPIEANPEEWGDPVTFPLRPHFDRDGRYGKLWHVDGDEEPDDAYVYRHPCHAEFNLSQEGMDDLVATLEAWSDRRVR